MASYKMKFGYKNVQRSIALRK